MKKLAFATALVLATASVAAADDHSTPGTPGDANCRGQTIAYLNAYVNSGQFGEGVRGIGGLAAADSYSVKDIQAIVTNYCSSTPF